MVEHRLLAWGGISTYEENNNNVKVTTINGVNGTIAYNQAINGGASVLDGYGLGGNAGHNYCTDGGNGYVKITAL